MLGRQGFAGVLIALSIWVSLFLQAAVTSAATDDGMEVLTRGPIHEAFAEVSVDETEPGMVTSGSVPDPINEIPPDYRPEGANVQWIPGYWSWDDDQNDFIWVSGIWRDVPPGRQWNPGYWMAVAGGNQFVSGYWTDINPAETVYLPPPPEPLRAVPGAPAFSSGNMWVDGHWVWSNNGYIWQAGYWLEQRPEMVWVPAHYVWTPRGYVFARGYWDYQLVRRGVMFAPRYYMRPIYRSHDYYYTPSIVLDIDSIFLSLFIRRDHHHHHYYFGDYYDGRYERRGFLPWYSQHATRHGYDPYYRSYRWSRLRDDKNWEHNYQQQFKYRRDHKEARPPAVYRSKGNRDFDRSHGEKNQMLGRPLNDVVKNRDHHVQFTRLSPDHKSKYQENSRKMSTSQAERRAAELTPDRNGRSRKNADIKKPEKENISTSPRMDNSGQTYSRDTQKARDTQKGNTQGNQYVRQHRQTFNQPLENQVESQPQRTENVRNSRPWIHQQRKEAGVGDDQPDNQPQRNQPRKLSQKAESRTQVPLQNNQVIQQPLKSERQKTTQHQVKQQRNQTLAVEAKKNNQPQPQLQDDQQKRRPRLLKNQNNDPAQVEQKVELPLNPEDQTEEQAVQNGDPQVKRPRKPWNQRTN